MVLDLEATGLDVRNDRIVQAAALPMLGAEIVDAPRLEQLVNPGIPIPESARRIHGLGDADVAGAPSFPEIVETLREILSGRVVVGHHIGFDLALLRNEAARAGIDWTEPPSLDIAMLLGAMAPSLPDLGLETVAKHLGITISGRHSAMGDSLAAAEAFAKLIPMMRARDIRTLGEAQALASRRDDLMLRQVQQGWHEPVAAPVEPEKPPFQIDSFVFQRRLEDLMTAPPVFGDRGMTLRTAAKAMVEQRIGALLVGDITRPPDGIVTERDLLRTMAQDGIDPDRTGIETVMNSPVADMRGDEMVYRALARMDRLGIRHLCVLDEAGLVAGMVSQRDLLQHRARSSTIIDDALVEADTVQALAAAYGRVPQAATQLAAEGLTGAEVGRIVSTELRALSRRATALALHQMKEAGQGEPPADWCFFLLGSAGRGESLLSADQDNALIHTGTEADDAWFETLGQRISTFLDEAGVPFCKGGVMAANAEWRGTVDDWRNRVGTWLQRARPEDILNVDIFFDLVPVAGNRELGHALHRDAVAEASQRPAFLGLLAASVDSYTPQFTLFGRPLVEDGRIDLKRNGTLPLVGFGRALALKLGVTARSTPARIQSVMTAGRIGEGDGNRLIDTHEVLMGYVLRQQIADIRDGIPPSSRVALTTLEKRERSDLRDRLHAVDNIVSQIRSLMAG
jgi:DNA polymerase-3 subunit epsilon/CBS domain-containing protein